MLLLVRLEAIEHARFRALAQITIDKEKGVEAFEEYMKIAFPYMEANKARERKEVLERMQNELKRGPLVVTALPQPKLKSRLKERMNQQTTPMSKQAADRLYSKLGPSIPIR